MRILADNPSMDFLRREAKDLLGALRESDDTATLADAQRTVAEEYGFRTWGDLKSEVDRRREELPEAPDGLTEGVAETFGLGAVKTSMTPIRYEYMGRRWHLESQRGRFMVSPVFDWINDEQAEVAVDLQERARTAGVLSPVPVRTPDGGLVRHVLEQNWRVDEWMDLGPTPVQPVHSSVARRVGELLAAVHEVAPKTDRRIEGQWVAADARPNHDKWAALLNRARAANMPWADELAALSRSIDELSTVTADAPPESVVITNCDIVVDAVRLGRGQELVVMHWDFAGPMVPEWELASTLLQWTAFGRDLEAARRLLDGYRARRGDASLTLGSFNTAITGWLTWTLHRGWEASGSQPPEQAEFAERALRAVLDDPLTVGKLEAFLAAL
jgi:hypothetical protein